MRTIKFLALFLFPVIALLAMRGFGIARAVTASSTASSDAASVDSGALQSQIDDDNQQIATLNQQIAQYQAKLQEIGADKKTLQAAINALDLRRSKVEAQVTLTQKQINATQLQIQQLGSQIVDTKQAIGSNESALAAYLRNLQVVENQPLILKLLGSNDLSQAWSEVNVTLQMEGDIKDKIESLRSQQSSLADAQTASQQKQSALTAQEQSLTSQQTSLAVTVASKNQLLADTKAQESNYQKLLADAEAQVKSFSAFVQNAGGSKLVGNQTICDAWGCYYNQRDTAWGSDKLNGTQFTLASDGCLVTSMAMVLTHYGYRNVTPVTINSNPDNFAVYYPAYLLYTINVDGVSATRKTTAIDATLATGNPVIVGLHAYGGTHFVVLTSGSNGHYIMRDPYVANGKDINFTSYYAVRNIFGISKVTIGA